MSDRGTFGGEWRRPDRSGMGRSQKELQDRASYDHAPSAGVSCMIPVVALLTLLAAVLGVTLG